jgi:hypothetical protein
MNIKPKYRFSHLQMNPFVSTQLRQWSRHSPCIRCALLHIVPASRAYTSMVGPLMCISREARLSNGWPADMRQQGA